MYDFFTKQQNFHLCNFGGTADDKLSMARLMKLESKGLENIVGKGENAGYQMYLQYFYL